MKIVLSRKGFDSSNGGIASPIFENGTMLSLPIPSKDNDKDKVKYSDLVCDGNSLSKILKDLGYRGVDCCHLDPDLVYERRKKPAEGWVPAFGQVNQSAKYLINNEISEGDLFLFFGNFRHVEKKEGKYMYARKCKDCADPYYGRELQAVWGYLQVKCIVSDSAEQMKFRWHPHSCDKRVHHENNNLIFTATEHVSFAPDMPGCGVLPYNIERVLSMPREPKATWKWQEAYNPKNIEGKRKNSAKNEEGIYYSGIWQELMLKENEISEDWAKKILGCGR